MSLWERLFPAPPDELKGALVEYQYRALVRTLPVVHVVTVLNFGIAAYALWADGYSTPTFAWIAAPVTVSLVRLVQWLRRSDVTTDVSRAASRVVGVERLLAVVMAVTSVFAAWTTAARVFSSAILIPVSLTFGALCLAHAMAAVPRTTIPTILNIIPPTLSMLVFGDGSTRLLSVSALSVAGLQIAYVSKSYASLLELLQLQKRLSDMASFDSLTGLMSRRALLDEVHRRIDAKTPFALALVDLDGFKAVNDTRGHSMGDALLRAVSKRFMACGEAVGRLGGDEFVVLLDGVTDAASCEPRVANILKAASEPVVVGGVTLKVSGSVGYSLFPTDGTESGTLMRLADEAMYAAKRSGKARALGRQTA